MTKKAEPYHPISSRLWNSSVILGMAVEIMVCDLRRLVSIAFFPLDTEKQRISWIYLRNREKPVAVFVSICSSLLFLVGVEWKGKGKGRIYLPRKSP